MNWDIELEPCCSMSRYMLCKAFILDLLLNAYVFVFYNIICCLLQLRIDVFDLRNILDLVLGSVGHLQFLIFGIFFSLIDTGVSNKPN